MDHRRPRAASGAGPSGGVTRGPLRLDVHFRGGPGGRLPDHAIDDRQHPGPALSSLQLGGARLVLPDRLTRTTPSSAACSGGGMPRSSAAVALDAICSSRVNVTFTIFTMLPDRPISRDRHARRADGRKTAAETSPSLPPAEREARVIVEACLDWPRANEPASRPAPSPTSTRAAGGGCRSTTSRTCGTLWPGFSQVAFEDEAARERARTRAPERGEEVRHRARRLHHRAAAVGAEKRDGRPPRDRAGAARGAR